MAIDSQSKRMSALLEGLVLATGVIDAAERAAAAWQYNGLTFSPPILATVPNADIIVGLNQAGNQGPSIGSM